MASKGAKLRALPGDQKGIARAGSTRLLTRKRAPRLVRIALECGRPAPVCCECTTQPTGPVLSTSRASRRVRKDLALLAAIPQVGEAQHRSERKNGESLKACENAYCFCPNVCRSRPTVA